MFLSVTALKQTESGKKYDINIDWKQMCVLFETREKI